MTASQLRDCASAVTGAGMDALAAEGWSGGAASAFFNVAGELSNTIDQGAEPLLRGAAACRAFASELAECQKEARDALHVGRAAQRRGEAAVVALAHAAAAREAAERDASEAALADTAASGSADMSGAADARRREHAARGRGDEARGQEDRARGALDNANAEVRHAIHRGERANERADDGGRRAQAVLADVAGAAKTARVPLGPVPVPVTPTSDNPDPLAGTTPFKPFHGLRPGDVRRRDIDEEAERERKAAESLTENPLQELGRQMFSSGFAPFDAATFGVAGKVVHKLPGGKRLYGNDAGIAKTTQWIGLGHAAERAGVHGAKAAAKGLKRIVERLPDGPIRPISGHTPIPREPRRNPVPRRRSSLARIRRPASLRYAGS